MFSVRSDIIEPKEVIKPLNEFGRQTPKDLRGFFYCLKIIIMAKIILMDGVINVKESYQQIRDLIQQGNPWLESIAENQELKMMERATNIEQDYRVLIQIKNIQCVKP